MSVNLQNGISQALKYYRLNDLTGDHTVKELSDIPIMIQCWGTSSTELYDYLPSLTISKYINHTPLMVDSGTKVIISTTRSQIFIQSVRLHIQVILHRIV